MKIAVCIPAYNRADTLPDALDSLLRQTGEPFDIHVFDNASTDGTRELMASRYPQVGYHRHAENLGYVGNLNACFSLHPGYDWIGILHSDDRHEGDSVAVVKELVAAHPDAGLIYSPAHLMDENGRVFEQARATFRVFAKGLEAVTRCQGQLPCSSIFYNSKALAEVGGYDPEFPYSADEEHNARIGGKYDILESGIVLAAYRRHEGHTMLKMWLQPDFIGRFEAMRLKMAGYAGLTGEADQEATRAKIGRTFLGCAYDLAEKGHRQRARDFYAYAWRHNRAFLSKPAELLKAGIALTPVAGPVVLKTARKLKRRLAARTEP